MIQLRKRPKNTDTADNAAAHLRAIKWSVDEAPSPPVLLLAADASSTTARRVHPFESAAEAEEFVSFWFPTDARTGLVGFWALSEPPTEDEAEVVVLVRDRRDGTLVHTFSFLDADAADGFLRAEVRRGLCLTDAALYYAVPVTFIGEGALMSPRIPPVVSRPEAAEFEPVRETCAEDVITLEAVVPFPPDFVERVLSVLRIPRWPSRAGVAFNGFRSPPGRF